MSWAIKRSDISDDQANFIRDMLCIQPVIQRNKYDTQLNPVLFYTFIDGVIHLPYLFASSMFKIIPNIHIHYPTTICKFTGTLRDYQIPLVEEAWEYMETLGTCILGLPPGYGKTVLGAKLAIKSGLITCILVHREILTTQWKNTFESFTDSKVWIVGEKNPTPPFDVIVCMDTRWDKIPKVMRDSIGFIIIDEAHTFCTHGRVNCLLAFHPKYILAESATLERDDNLHTMIYAMCGDHGVYRVRNEPFTVIKVNTGVKPERRLNKMGTIDWSALVKSSLFNERRNKIISNLVAENGEKHILILTSLVAHAKFLYKELLDTGESCDFMCGKRNSYDNCRVLVGTISKISTGFDPSALCSDFMGNHFNMLILCCSIKKYSLLEQSVGRCFRVDNPTIYHLVDNDSIFKSHWQKAQRWYRTRKGQITEYTPS